MKKLNLMTSYTCTYLHIIISDMSFDFSFLAVVYNTMRNKNDFNSSRCSNSSKE